jgi:uncharacterized protein YndB with AHSA1/START domain
VNTTVYVRNELLMPGVEIERVWVWLCRPSLWPSWYSNSANVHIKNQTQSDLRFGTEFRWKTFGGTIDTTILEFVRHERLAWDAHRNGVISGLLAHGTYTQTTTGTTKYQALNIAIRFAG